MFAIKMARADFRHSLSVTDLNQIPICSKIILENQNKSFLVEKYLNFNDRIKSVKRSARLFTKMKGAYYGK